MQSRIVFHVYHDNPLPPNLVTGMCQDDGPADALGAYLKEACGCTALLTRVLPGESVYWVDADGCRYYVHISEEFVIVTSRELDNDRLKGITLSRRSKHINTFAGTSKDIEQVCTRIAKEAHRG